MQLEEMGFNSAFKGLQLVDLQNALRVRIYNGQFRALADLKKPRLVDDKDAFPHLL